MSVGLTNAELAAIRERCEKSTAGPWVCSDGTIDGVCHMIEHGNLNTIARTGQLYNHADEAFIVHARTDVPKLLAEIDRLKAEIAAQEGWDR